MELARLMEALSCPSAYPQSPGEVQVRQTHISVVFLAGRHAYKIKKPVALGFLDFSTLEARRHFCRPSDGADCRAWTARSSLWASLNACRRDGLDRGGIRGACAFRPSRNCVPGHAPDRAT